DFHVTGVQTCALPILESGNLWVKVTQNTQDYLEDILGFETIPNAKKTLEIVDAMIDYVSTSRNENVLDNKIKSKQFVLDVAELRSEERRVGKECRSRW